MGDETEPVETTGLDSRQGANEGRSAPIPHNRAIPPGFVRVLVGRQPVAEGGEPGAVITVPLHRGRALVGAGLAEPVEEPEAK